MAKTRESTYRAKDIALALGADIFGDEDFLIHSVSEPANALPGQITIAVDKKYEKDLLKGNASAAVLWPEAEWEKYGLDVAILVRRPRYAMSNLTALMDPGQGVESGVHETAYVHSNAVIEENVAIGAFCYVGKDVFIGKNSVILPHCYIGSGSSLGKNCRLREGVKIGARVRIGDRFVAQPGAVIGGEGLSFVTENVSTVENVRKTLGDKGTATDQNWKRIHSIGGVKIGDDVELGANTCIDYGTIRDTEIGNGVKFDNLVHVGHNVVISENCMICGQVGIAGSVTLGKNVVLGGQTGINDNIFVGDNVIAGGATKIFTNVPAGRVILGSPATKMTSQIEAYKTIRRLPRLFAKVAEIQKTLSKITNSK